MEAYHIIKLEHLLQEEIAKASGRMESEFENIDKELVDDDDKMDESLKIIREG